MWAMELTSNPHAIKSGDMVSAVSSSRPSRFGRIKPCPFCGSQIFRGGHADGGFINHVGSSRVMIGCGTFRCEVKPRIERDTEEEAIRAWNQRA